MSAEASQHTADFWLIMNSGAETRLDLPTGVTIIAWESWSHQMMNTSFVSIPELVNENRDWLRATYCNWLREFGQAHFRSGSIESYLQIRSNLSYWWMTLPTEATLLPRSSSMQLVKMFMLSKFCEENRILRLTVIGGSASELQTLLAWSRNAGCRLQIVQVGANERTRKPIRLRGPEWSVKRLVQIQSGGETFLIAIRALLSTFRMALSTLAGLFSNPHRPSRHGDQISSELALIDYAGSFETETLAQGNFRSRYWGPLTSGSFTSKGTLWLHRRVGGAKWPNLQRQNGIRRSIAIGQSIHLDVTNVRSLLAWFKAMVLFSRIAAHGLRIARARYLFQTSIRGIDAWPLVKRFWFQRLLGAQGLSDILWLLSIENELSALPIKRQGVYLMENQPWELALVSAWQRAKPGPMIGFVHTPVRFWDVRFCLYGCSSGNNTLGLPDPSLIAVSGSFDYAALANTGTPAEMMTMVEALRFLAICSGRQERASLADLRSNTSRILILGEYDHQSAQQQVEALSALVEQLPETCEVYFRSHPASPGEVNAHRKIRKPTDSSSMGGAYEDYDGIIVGETSSVVFEALLAKVPTAIMSSPLQLATSAARDFGDLPVLNSDQEVLAWIQSVIKKEQGASTIDIRDAFNLDPSLPAWRRLLGDELWIS